MIKHHARLSRAKVKTAIIMLLLTTPSHAMNAKVGVTGYLMTRAEYAQQLKQTRAFSVDNGVVYYN